MTRQLALYIKSKCFLTKNQILIDLEIEICVICTANFQIFDIKKIGGRKPIYNGGITWVHSVNTHDSSWDLMSPITQSVHFFFKFLFFSATCCLNLVKIDLIKVITCVLNSNWHLKMGKEKLWVLTSFCFRFWSRKFKHAQVCRRSRKF